MSTYKEIINRAQFMARSPDQVFNILEQSQYKKSRSVEWGSGRIRKFHTEEPIIYAETQKALIARNEPLINLALAKFSFDDDIVRELFENAQGADDQSQAIVLSALSNQCVDTPVPGCIFGINSDSKDKINAWFKSASENCIIALFENPNIDNRFLYDFLKGKENWLVIDEKRRIRAIYALSSNPRMKTPYYDEFRIHWDDFSELEYDRVFSAAWKLAKTVPVSKDWAACLGYLLSEIVHTESSMKDSLIVAKRWFPNETSDFYMHQVRQSLAERALLQQYDLLPSLLASDDPALRCAAYTVSDLKSKQIKKIGDEDEEFAWYCLYNENLYRNRSTRRELETISNHNEYGPGLFLMKCKKISEKHPDWFRDEDEEQIYEPIDEQPEDKHVTVGNLNDAATIIIKSHREQIKPILPFLLFVCVIVAIKYFF